MWRGFGKSHPMKEASARIKINKLLEEADWRFLYGPKTDH